MERCAAGVEGKERSMWKLNATCAGKKGEGGGEHRAAGGRAACY